MNPFLGKVKLMVQLKEKIYSIKNDSSKQEEYKALVKLLQRIQKNPELKSI